VKASILRAFARLGGAMTFQDRDIIPPETQEDVQGRWGLRRIVFVVVVFNLAIWGGLYFLLRGLFE
jgi:hypothetical protein